MQIVSFCKTNQKTSRVNNLQWIDIQPLLDFLLGSATGRAHGIEWPITPLAPLTPS